MGEKLKYSDVISLLKLQPLPAEGGFFRQTYKSSKQVHLSEFGRRAISTAIYYLITKNEFSVLHRLKQDEIFHFYAGEPVEMMQVSTDSQHKISIIGNDLSKGHLPQVVVPAGVWQGTKLLNADDDDWALLGTTVAPGFEFEDFELGERSSLVVRFPHLVELIIKFTRD